MIIKNTVTAIITFLLLIVISPIFADKVQRTYNVCIKKYRTVYRNTMLRINDYGTQDSRKCASKNKTAQHKCYLKSYKRRQAERLQANNRQRSAAKICRKPYNIARMPYTQCKEKAQVKHHARMRLFFSREKNRVKTLKENNLPIGRDYKQAKAMRYFKVARKFESTKRKCRSYIPK